MEDHPVGHRGAREWHNSFALPLRVLDPQKK
jgi:hypothetical protein